MYKKFFACILTLSLAVGSVALPGTDNLLGGNSISVSAYNSFAATKEVATGQVYSDALVDSDDGSEKYYTFTLESDGYIDINFYKAYDEAGYEKGWRVTLYNSYYEEVTSDAFYTGNTVTEKTSSKIGFPKGKYYLKVSPYNSSYFTTADYGFKINYGKSSVWEKEFNDNFETANTIKTNTKYHGSIRNGDESDVYKIYIPSQGKYNLFFGKAFDYSDYEKGWNIIIYNSNMNEIDSNAVYCGDKSTEKFSYRFNKGTYYIKICAYNHYHVTHVPYKFIVSRDVPNISKATVTGVYARLYTGKAITLKNLSVKVNGIPIKNGTDYTVTYKNNVEVGTATVIIKAKGSNYKGTITKTFKIKPAKPTVKTYSGKKKAAIAWKKVKGATGYKAYLYNATKKKWIVKTVKGTSYKFKNLKSARLTS